MNLQLSLKTRWFEMTKSGVKTEDYRDITPFWATRLLGESQAFWKGYLGYNSNNKRCYGFKDQSSIDFIISKCKGFKPFETNTMTLGYPKSSDTERVLKLEHKGIEIRKGNPEWGAEPDKLYFVIKHGKTLLTNGITTQKTNRHIMKDKEFEKIIRPLSLLDNPHRDFMIAVLKGNFNTWKEKHQDK